MATPPISTHYAIVSSAALSAVLLGLQSLRTIALISSVINDSELLAALIRLLIRIVKKGIRGLWTAKGTREARHYCQNRKDPFD